jgi:peptide/nickel transport system ATP-binding protein
VTTLDAVAQDPGTLDAVARIENLSITFRRGGLAIQAVRGVSLEVRRGEILGLVGESGSGKSVLGMSLLGLLPTDPAPVTSGAVTVRGQDMLNGPAGLRRSVRRAHLGAVFQDPMTSLNPTMRVGRQVIEAAGSEEEAVRLLRAVGVPDAGRRMASFPHELSGGLRQRVMIAMAIAGHPALVIADEPTTALDVMVQAQVLALLRSLRDEIGCSFLMITHDLGVAAQVADRIAVMYGGRLAELGPTAAVLRAAAHPYSAALTRSRLSLSSHRDRPLATLPGEVPDPASPPPGCPFEPRCPLAFADCLDRPPDPAEVAAGHLSACLRPPGEVAAELHTASPGTAPSGTAPSGTAPSGTAPSGTAPSGIAPSGTAPPGIAPSGTAPPGIAPSGAGDPAAPPTASAPPAEADANANAGAGAETVAAARVNGAAKTFRVKAGRRRVGLQALRDVSLHVTEGESVAIVGESGSGKSTLLRVIAGLERPDRGQITLGPGAGPQMVFQDAGASLTPWLTVGALIGERLQGAGVGGSARRGRVEEALAHVGLPANVAGARAAQLSGGQRQRVALARATVVPPEVLLCDEPTSALDVSLAAVVLNLVTRLRRELGMAVLFVTHDLSVARLVADRIAVMYLGRVVELGPAEEVVARPRHPYTRALVQAVPDLGVTPSALPGEPASPLDPPPGCAFHPRCPVAQDSCADPEYLPRLTRVRGERQRTIACVHTEAAPWP